MPMRTVIIQIISYDFKDKVKTTVKDKCKKNQILRERDVEAVTIGMSNNNLCLSRLL